MPRTSQSPRHRVPLWIGLGLIVLLSGLLLQGTTVAVQTPDALATPAPSFAPDVSFSPTPTPAPTQVFEQAPTESPPPAATPVLLGGVGAPQVVFVDPTATPPSAGETVVSIHSALPSEGDALSPEPTLASVPSLVLESQATATPVPTSTPTYQYEDSQARVEIRRCEDNNIVYFAVELWLTDATQLRTAFARDRFDSGTESVLDIAARNGAIVAINGDFATFNNGGIILRNGELFRSNRSSRQLLVIDQNGDFIPYTTSPAEPEAAAETFLAEGVWQTLVFGPVLVAEGEAVPLPEKFFISTAAKEPRTAIAQKGPLHYLLLVVDGRQAGYSVGVSLGRLQELLLEHGAITGFNLDGGGSSTLYFDGEIINKPANGGQRHVPDILFVSGN